MEIKTDKRYWDCDCKDHYIHLKTDELVCPVCGANECDGYPDSRIDEIAYGSNFFKAEYNLNSHWETTDYDIQVIGDSLGMNLTEEKASEIYLSLNHYEIEQAALKSNDPEEQIKNAYEEIKNQICAYFN